MEAHFLSSQMCVHIHVFASYECSNAQAYVGIHMHKSYDPKEDKTWFFRHELQFFSFHLFQY